MAMDCYECKGYGDDYSYDPETDSIAAEGTFGEDSVAITFSYDEQRNVVWTENGESTVLEYSYLTD